MDFKRIELIFLCAFLSLNAFLYYTYHQSNLDQASEPDINTVAAIEKRLEGDKITFTAPFSHDITQGYYLSGQSTDFTQTELSVGDVIEYQRLFRNYQASPSLYLSKKEPEKDLQQFLKSAGDIYAQKDYRHLNQSVAEESQYTFSQEFETIPFNDETSALVFDIGEISATELMVRSYTQTHLDELEPLREAQDVIAEADAVDTLYMSNKIPNEGKILKTELAYTRLFTVREKNVYIPAWFVWLENSKGNIQLERVNGFSNSIISASVPEVKK